MHRTRIAVLTIVAAVALTGFAAAISAASAPLQSPGSLLVGLPQPPQVRESPRLSALARSKAVTSDSFPAIGAGRVRVVVESDTPLAARTAIEAAGGTVERSWRNLVQADVSASSVAALDRQRSVDSVRAPYRHVDYAVSGEEVAASLAPAWHAKGFTGKGVKVAIIDDGFVGLAERQAAGEVPASAVTQDFCGGKFNTASEHGTAVAEIVHEIAPEAQLYLICVDTEVDLAAAEVFAKGQGANVISHSLGWYGPDRGDGTGPIGAVVSDARAAGILWVNAAGNEAPTHWSGTFASIDGDRWHEYAPGDEGNTFIWPDDEVVCAFLKWDEWPAGISDFDLYLALAGSNAVVGRSVEEQSGRQPPYEELCMYQDSGDNITAYWGIVGYSVSTSPRLDMFTISSPLQYQVAAGSIGEPATSPAALAVGALCWQSREPEFYSSQGPTIDGRVKPDIAGHDGISGTTYGASTGCLSGFSGTSAAAPEVSGAAALVKQAFPKYGPDQLRRYLQKSARDMGAAGMDNVTGAGELQLPKAPDVVPPTARALASTGRAGKTVRLLSAIADNEGMVTVVEQVKKNGKVVKTLRRAGSVAATSPKTVATPWTAPAKPKGTFQHCAVAVDAAGNRSPESCARIVLR
jgi:subtilisin family serine protease